MRQIIAITLLGSVALSGCTGSSQESFSQSSSFSIPNVGAQTPVSAEGDKYEGVGTQPFVMVAHDPLSTFAADVDTASYDIFRRDVQNSSRLPGPESVRIEEYINYFAYDYLAPAPGDDHPFSINLDMAPSFFGLNTAYVRVGIQGELPPIEEKKSANLVFLIDVSGSMQSAAKLPLVKALLKEAVAVLDETDTVSIVTYASGVRVRLAPTPISEANKILSTLDSLTAGGSTNGAGGIQLAYEQAVESYIDDGINHVILCTDGDFNVGLSSNNALVSFIEEKRETGVTFTALGFGSGNLNDAMLEATSNAGNGVYGVITSLDNAIDYAQDRLLGNLHLIAKDVKIQVEFNPNLISAYRLIGYDNRAIEDEQFNDDTVDAGEVGAGHSVTALYEVAFSSSDIPMPEGAPLIDDGADFDGQLAVNGNNLIRVSVRYKHLEATVDDAAFELSESLVNEMPLVGSVDGDFQWAVAVASFAEIVKQGPFSHATTLDAIEMLLANNVGDDPDRREFSELVSQARLLLPAEMDTAEMDTAEMDTAEMDTAEMDAAEMDTAEMDTAEMDTAEMDATEMDTAEIR